MTGHHEVRVFTINAMQGHAYDLPEGWKPFSAEVVSGGAFVLVVARRWVRSGS